MTSSLPFFSPTREQSEIKHSDHIRVIVNGAVQKLPNCNSGPGGSCPLLEFKDYVQTRAEAYSDFEGACKAK